MLQLQAVLYAQENFDGNNRAIWLLTTHATIFEGLEIFIEVFASVEQTQLTAWLLLDQLLTNLLFELANLRRLRKLQIDL